MSCAGMSSASANECSEAAEEGFYDKRYPRRSCPIADELEEGEIVSTDDGNSSESDVEKDNSSDEDFSLNKKKTAKRKKKQSKIFKEKRKRTPKIVIPEYSFERVVEAQQQHAQRFLIDDADDDDDRDSDSPVGPGQHEQEIPESSKRKLDLSTVQEPPKEKRKKVIIYPWNPIGITGGRRPPE